MAFSEEIKNTIRERLNKKFQEKGKNLTCPACGNDKFILADGYSNDSLKDSIDGSLVLGGPVIPTVVIVCEHCGNILKFSAGVLGLLPDPEPNKESQEIKADSVDTEQKK